MLKLAPHARVWIFQADRFLSDMEVSFLKSEMDSFMASWAAHGNELFGDFSVVSDLFLLVGADEQRAPASGCSIDTLMRKIQDLANSMNINFLDRLRVAYEDGTAQIHLVTLDQFKQLMKEQTVSADTTVYNNLIETVGQLEQNWRTKVSDSWHKNLVNVL